MPNLIFPKNLIIQRIGADPTLLVRYVRILELNLASTIRTEIVGFSKFVMQTYASPIYKYMDSCFLKKGTLLSISVNHTNNLLHFYLW
jgi:hypothetical protein